MMGRELYFAYGSNMVSKQMLERCPDCEVTGVAKLVDHRLAFTRFSRNRQSWVADIVEAPGSDVWGVLYGLSRRDRDELDANEGHPSAYRRGPITVLDVDGNVVAACTYRVVTKQPEKPPAAAYWRLLVEGAREHGLPPDYIARLETLERADDPHG